jgi:hypothetical protein
MNTFRRFAVLTAVLSAAACSSPVTYVDEAHTYPGFAQDQPTPEHSSTTTAPVDSVANRGGGNLMGGN